MHLKLLFSGLLLFSAISAYTQNPFMNDGFGRPIRPQLKYVAEGSIYFPDEYTYANIVDPTGKMYYDIKVKINLLDNTLLYVDSTDAEMEVAIPVAKVVFTDMIDQKERVFIFIDQEKSYFQLLDSGKVSLLKKTIITYRDKATYASTVITRVFEQKHTYLSYKNAMLSGVERSRSSVLEVLADKSIRVDAFIEQQKLKMKKEEDLIKIFRFYNSL